MTTCIRNGTLQLVRQAFARSSYGKTTLASEMVDVPMASTLSPKPLVAYCCCDFAEQIILPAEESMGSLPKQSYVNGYISKRQEKTFP